MKPETLFSVLMQCMDLAIAFMAPAILMLAVWAVAVEDAMQLQLLRGVKREKGLESD